MIPVFFLLVVQVIGMQSYLASQSEEGERFVYIEPGTGTLGIAKVLKKKGVIRHGFLFLLLASLRGSHGRLKPGEYEFSPRMSLLEVLKKLEEGRVVVHQAVIPEGFTVKEISRLLANMGLADEGRFLAIASDLEGYLFPDTYYLTRGMSEEAIVQMMLNRFRQVFGPAGAERAKALGMSVREVVTLASLVEKEAKVSGERVLISAVFHNRLRYGMPLQSDPTVIYALPQFTGHLRRVDLSIPSPYNTYLHKGLPPGPIANPGRSSILAVLYPANVDYLYFVSRNDGTHVFSRTLAEHERAVRRYQQGG
jgi:UPF0755 protein